MAADFLNAKEGWYWPWEPPDSPTASPGGPVKGRLDHTIDEGRTWTGIEPDKTLQHFLPEGGFLCKNSQETIKIAEIFIEEEKIGNNTHDDT